MGGGRRGAGGVPESRARRRGPPPAAPRRRRTRGSRAALQRPAFEELRPGRGGRAPPTPSRSPARAAHQRGAARLAEQPQPVALDGEDAVVRALAPQRGVCRVEEQAHRREVDFAYQRHHLARGAVEREDQQRVADAPRRPQARDHLPEVLGPVVRVHNDGQRAAPRRPAPQHGTRPVPRLLQLEQRRALPAAWRAASCGVRRAEVRHEAQQHLPRAAVTPRGTRQVLRRVTARPRAPPIALALTALSSPPHSRSRACWPGRPGAPRGRATRGSPG